MKSSPQNSLIMSHSSVCTVFLFVLCFELLCDISHWLFFFLEWLMKEVYDVKLLEDFSFLCFFVFHGKVSNTQPFDSCCNIYFHNCSCNTVWRMSKPKTFGFSNTKLLSSVLLKPCLRSKERSVSYNVLIRRGMRCEGLHTVPGRQRVKMWGDKCK